MLSRTYRICRHVRQRLMREECNHPSYDEVSNHGMIIEQKMRCESESFKRARNYHPFLAGVVLIIAVHVLPTDPGQIRSRFTLGEEKPHIQQLHLHMLCSETPVQ